MWVLATWSAHARPLCPPSTLAEIFLCMCLLGRGGTKSHLHLGHLLLGHDLLLVSMVANPKKNLQITTQRGAEICFGLESLYFSELGAHAKF